MVPEPTGQERKKLSPRYPAARRAQPPARQSNVSDPQISLTRLFFQYPNAVGASDADFRRESDEEAVLDEADDVIEVLRQRNRRGDGAECAIENIVAAIAHEGLAIGVSTKHRLRA